MQVIIEKEKKEFPILHTNVFDTSLYPKNLGYDTLENEQEYYKEYYGVYLENHYSERY